MSEPASAARFSIPLPDHMKHLPRDDRGFVVPWFVEWIDGKPDFPKASARKFAEAVKEKRCWVCGHKLGRWMTFVVGPMCVVNRVTAEPPSHDGCARYSAMVCPFIVNPRMRRVPQAPGTFDVIGGIMSEANPGTTALWSCREYRVFRTPTGPLIRMGEPVGGVTWWARGHELLAEDATRGFDEGCARLRRLALQLDGPKALPDLEELIIRARTVALPLR